VLLYYRRLNQFFNSAWASPILLLDLALLFATLLGLTLELTLAETLSPCIVFLPLTLLFLLNALTALLTNHYTAAFATVSIALVVAWMWMNKGWPKVFREDWAIVFLIAVQVGVFVESMGERDKKRESKGI